MAPMTMIASLASKKETSQNGSNHENAKAKRVDKIKNLYASGSTISPKLEDHEYFLAKNPSNQSDNPATANKDRAIASLP